MLARDRATLQSDVLLVPHHGSKTSSTPSFIDAVSPSEAIFSVGYRNRFHHPNPAVVTRYAARRITMWRTDDEGAIRVRLPAQPGAQPSISGQEAACRYWSVRSTC